MGKKKVISGFGDDFTESDIYLLQSINVHNPDQVLEASEEFLRTRLEEMCSKYRDKMQEGLIKVTKGTEQLPDPATFIRIMRNVAALSVRNKKRAQKYFEDMAAPISEKQLINGWHHRNGARVD